VTLVYRGGIELIGVDGTKSGTALNGSEIAPNQYCDRFSSVEGHAVTHRGLCVYR
jgi:hypothetical protein